MNILYLGLPISNCISYSGEILVAITLKQVSSMYNFNTRDSFSGKQRVYLFATLAIHVLFPGK